MNLVNKAELTEQDKKLILITQQFQEKIDEFMLSNSVTFDEGLSVLLSGLINSILSHSDSIEMAANELVNISTRLVNIAITLHPPEKTKES